MSDAPSHPRDDVPEPDPTTRSRYLRHGAPVPLLVAAALTLVQGLATVVFGVVEAVSLHSDRLLMGATTGLFFLAYGGALVVCAWGLSTVRPWSRGPVLLAQLIWLGLAWNFRTGSTLPLAIGLLVVAVVVLAGLLHPRSIEALENAA